ncbi:MBOAT-domain-containing protein [Schizopora paradoxa]|uniref:MBOAT-domain-containing protein n=1 Tax=Schizopora paradoxa TaxID=27342 RepID=A0A0H2S6R8_9AGAM|nr:MBOAT-domain-containing protein [Schizopora paradoxa]
MDDHIELRETSNNSEADDALYHLIHDSVVEPRREGILRLTVKIPVPPSSQQAIQARPPARWRTPEFIFYGLAFVIAIPVMIWKTVNLSRESHPNYKLYSYKLTDGWIPGRKFDNSDAQYRTFRNSVGLLTIIAAGFFVVKSLHRLVIKQTSPPKSDRLHRIPFLVAFSAIFLLGLHGLNALKILLIFYLNYLIAKGLGPSKLTPAATWLFNLSVLFAIDRFSGFPFVSLHPSLAFLDDFQGAYPRWYIPFNITMLRLVSFNMDYYWASRKSGPSEVSEPVVTHKQRTTKHHDLETYNFRNFCAYAAYPPLFLAGPIMTFNDFMWQHRMRDFIPTRWNIATYAFRFLSCLLAMEIIQHYMYVVAIKDRKAWIGDSPFELSMIGLWNLVIVWLKLLLPWRFFRLWALADGMDPPENMVRCVLNNYSTFGFWRAWHRSFNLWIVRYIYIPLGGTKNLLVVMALVFSFVALWHDLTFRLLAWGWLVTLFLIPEVAARYLLPATRFGTRWWYRHVSAIGAVGNVLMMITANLVGFVIGVDGISYFLGELFGTVQGLQFLFLACACVFIAVQVMFEYREEEMRNGIFRKC